MGGSATKTPRRVQRWLPVPKLKSEVILTGGSPQNYFHWLIEDLPAVIRGRELYPNAQVVVHPHSAKYVFETLDFLDIDFIKSRKAYSPEKLVLAGRGHDSGWPHPDDVALLRRSFGASGTSQSETSKIYVSRLGARRSLPGEKRFQDSLRGEGFQVLNLEDLPFRDQLTLFSSRLLLVGPHGAGLSNSVFMSPGSSVIEISAADHTIPCFELLANLVGAKFRRVTYGQASRTPKGPQREHYEVSVQNLLAELA